MFIFLFLTTQICFNWQKIAKNLMALLLSTVWSAIIDGKQSPIFISFHEHLILFLAPVSLERKSAQVAGWSSGCLPRLTQHHVICIFDIRFSFINNLLFYKGFLGYYLDALLKCTLVMGEMMSCNIQKLFHEQASYAFSPLLSV